MVRKTTTPELIDRNQLTLGRAPGRWCAIALVTLVMIVALVTLDPQPVTQPE